MGPPRAARHRKEFLAMQRKIVLAAILVAAGLGAGKASALTVPFTEDFAANVSGWEDNVSDPLAWALTGGPQGDSFASTVFSWFGFESQFGGGPVLFRAHDNDDASGDAYVGDWLAGGVGMVSAMVYHEAPVNLNFFVRVSTRFNFPGAVMQNTLSVEPFKWTYVYWIMDPNSPLCIEETVSCATALANVGNLQIGTDAPASLVDDENAYFVGVDRVRVVPEPSESVLLGSGLIGLFLLGRRRRVSS
jgi:hypothetical protein